MKKDSHISINYDVHFIQIILTILAYSTQRNVHPYRFILQVIMYVHHSTFAVSSCNACVIANGDGLPSSDSR